MDSVTLLFIELGLLIHDNDFSSWKSVEEDVEVYDVARETRSCLFYDRRSSKVSERWLKEVIFRSETACAESSLKIVSPVSFKPKGGRAKLTVT